MQKIKLHMGFKEVLIIICALFIILLMFFYFVPFNTINFGMKSGNSNFSVIPGSEMQFYPNMRFSTPDISYRIFNCPLQKQGDMEYAFGIIENLTPLRFYSVTENEEISVTCSSKNIVDNGMFIAGEGGPTNITVSGGFNVIDSGEILLIKQSDCPKPNVAIHELFHVLGFEHSSNPSNIMYNVTSCSQTIGTDMIQLINNLYSIPSYPDLAFGNVSAVMNGRYLNVNMAIMNIGLADAEASQVNIYADGNNIKQLDLAPLKLGYGRIVELQNLFITQLNVNELDFVISDNFFEISKDNNNLTLNINN